MHEFDKCIAISKQGVKLAEGFVHDFQSDTMKIFTQGENNISISPLMEIYIYVYNSVKGECKYFGVVERSNFNNIAVSDVNLVSSLQKRDNTRVNIQLKYRLTQIFESNNIKVKLDRPVDITVLNISAQGLYFNCVDSYEVGTRFPMVFKETSRPVSLVLEIVRKEEYTRSCNYGCMFADISEKDMDELFRFVLREQIVQRRKSMYY